LQVEKTKLTFQLQFEIVKFSHVIHHYCTKLHVNEEQFVPFSLKSSFIQPQFWLHSAERNLL